MSKIEVQFTKRFISGPSKGQVFNDSYSFDSLESAMLHVSNIDAHSGVPIIAGLSAYTIEFIALSEESEAA